MPGRQHEFKPSPQLNGNKENDVFLRLKRKTFFPKTSHSCKGPAVRITKENQPKGKSMMGKKKQNKTGKIYIEAILFFLHYDAETSVTKH